MPTYEYICLSCGNRFDRFQGINEVPLNSCPDCTGVVKRMITGGTGFIMKGGSGDTGGDNSLKPACGRDTTCCGSDHACGKSHDCDH